MSNSGHSPATLVRPGILDTVTSDYVTTGEAARAIGVGHMTLLRWMKAGQVTPAAKTPGGQYRWDLDDLKRQLRERASQEVNHGVTSGQPPVDPQRPPGRRST